MQMTDNVSQLVSRSDRVVCVEQDWYFKTIGGDLLGPYPSMEDAEFGIDVYRALMRLDEVELQVA